MPGQAVKTRNTITLRGSTQIVSEFFNFAVNSILFQRGIYPADTFEPKQKYGLCMMVSTDEKLSKYLSDVGQQMTEWLQHGQLQRLVLVVTDVQSKQALERWSFEVQTDSDVLQGGIKPEKSGPEITAEIQAIIRQITSAVSFLPLLNDPCTFDLLVYTDVRSVVPGEWEESDPRMVSNAQKVLLRSFTTKVHKVEASVTYKAVD